MKPSYPTRHGESVQPVCSISLFRGLCGLVAAGFFGLQAPQAGAWERTDVLDAIHQVENPHNTTRIGRRGELGPFQFRPAVWYTYTQKPFALATERSEAQVIAEAHYEWIKRGLERNKLDVTPYHIGLAWNAGLHATINGRATDRSKYYAERVSNLVESKVASAATSPVVPAGPPQAEAGRLTENL